jgi:hypothetical protein
MDTFATILRYGFLAALLIEALLLGRVFLRMLREKAQSSKAPAGADAPAAAEE